MPCGRLIVVEGIDGAGKSSLAARITQRLNRLNTSTNLIREPGGNETAEKIRILVKDPATKMSARTQALMMNAARSELAEDIQTFLEAGVWGVCDRNFISTLIYQGYGQGLNIEGLLSICRFALNGLEADLTLILDLDYETGMQRQLGDVRDAPDRFDKESREFFMRLIQGYHEIAERFNCPLIDASGSPEEVLELAWAHIEPMMISTKED